MESNNKSNNKSNNNKSHNNKSNNNKNNNNKSNNNKSNNNNNNNNNNNKDCHLCLTFFASSTVVTSLAKPQKSTETTILPHNSAKQ